jgi:acyl carrier protein
MNRNDLLNQLQEIGRAVFKEPGLILQENTKLEDIRSWNSLTHIMFIDTIEKKFNFQFSFEDMLAISTIKAICDIIEQK